MLISIREGKIISKEEFREFTIDGISFYLDGVIFKKGLKEGEESLQKIAQEYRSKEGINFRDLYGAFALIMDTGQEMMVCTDNSSMRGLFISSSFIGNDFVEVCKRSGNRKLNEETLCEYLTFTRHFMKESLVEGVTILDPALLYCLQGGQIIRRSKKMGDLESGSSISDPKAFFEDVAHAFSDHRVICALTGGYDSRLVAAAYHAYHPETKCFISGDNLESKEIICADQCARAGGMDMIHIIPELPEPIDEGTIRMLFEQGYQARMNTAGCRIGFFMNALSKQYDILLSGNAGDMHKEFWFRQDFPFYWSRKSKIKRFVDSRYIVTDRSIYLSKKMGKVYSNLREDAYHYFSTWIRERNAQTYFLSGWDGEWCSGALKNTQSRRPFVYSPLQEFELVKYAYDILPKGKRMNLFHRKLTSFYNYPMARTKTMYGTTAGDKWWDLTADQFRQLGAYYRSAKRYLYRKMHHANREITPGVEKNKIDARIRDTDTGRKSFQWARDQEILDPNLNEDDLPDDLAGKILYCYMLAQDLEQKL